MSDTKELQVREKQEVPASAEQTRPGRIFTPSVDIFETEGNIVLLADMPGVNNDDVTIDLRENVLTLTGDVKVPEGENEEQIFMEYEVGRYYRQFTLSEVIDQAGIEAALDKGVLKLTLPKAEKAKPKQIKVSVA